MKYCSMCHGELHESGVTYANAAKHIEMPDLCDVCFEIILKREQEYKDLILMDANGIKFPEFWCESEEIGRLNNGR